MHELAMVDLTNFNLLSFEFHIHICTLHTI
jgi:hypothetical protein